MNMVTVVVTRVVYNITKITRLLLKLRYPGVINISKFYQINIRKT